MCSIAGRPEFVTAENLQAYLAYHMPKVKLQPLTEADYWDIVLSLKQQAPIGQAGRP